MFPYFNYQHFSIALPDKKYREKIQKIRKIWKNVWSYLVPFGVFVSEYLRIVALRVVIVDENERILRG